MINHACLRVSPISSNTPYYLTLQSLFTHIAIFIPIKYNFTHKISPPIFLVYTFFTLVTSELIGKITEKCLDKNLDSRKEAGNQALQLPPSLTLGLIYALALCQGLTSHLHCARAQSRLSFFHNKMSSLPRLAPVMLVHFFWFQGKNYIVMVNVG